MYQPFTTQRRVEFCETDAAGIAHFSSFFIYMEQSEHALLRHCGLSVAEPVGGGWHLSWPRVHVECDYSGAVKFEDEMNISVGIYKLGDKSITYQIEFFVGERQIARGQTVAVCCRVKPGEPLESVQIPTSFADKLRPFLMT